MTLIEGLQRILTEEPSMEKFFSARLCGLNGVHEGAFMVCAGGNGVCLALFQIRQERVNLLGC